MARNRSTIAKRKDRFLLQIRIVLLSQFGRMLRYGLVLTGLVAFFPLGLTILYASPYVHPVSTLMLAHMIKGQSVERKWVALDQINPVLVFSVMMSEDARFCAHKGIDWQALDQVIDDAMEGEQPRGASTISMQTVKNLYLWSSRSYIRKALELPLALWVDAIWTKQRTIEIYLNIAQWGEGIFGIEAAAQYYFNRSAANLSAYQSALLAVTLPSPKHRNPTKATKRLSQLANTIERRAYQSGAYVQCVQ